jgi:hypothetical protein
VAESRDGTWLVRGGAACFFVGLVFAAVVFFPFLVGVRNAPAALALGTMLAPIGFAAAIAGLYRQARAAQRALLAAAERPTEPGT